MSGPLFSFRYPYDVTRRPTPEPEVRRAILASWENWPAPVRSRPQGELPNPSGSKRLLHRGAEA